MPARPSRIIASPVSVSRVLRSDGFGSFLKCNLYQADEPVSRESYPGSSEPQSQNYCGWWPDPMKQRIGLGGLCGRRNRRLNVHGWPATVSYSIAAAIAGPTSQLAGVAV